VDILKKAGHASTSAPLHAYFKKTPRGKPSGLLATLFPDPGDPGKRKELLIGGEVVTKSVEQTDDDGTVGSGSGIDRLESHAARRTGSRLFGPHLRVHRAGGFIRWSGARDDFLGHKNLPLAPRK
jgi:hypothetical protein